MSEQEAVDPMDQNQNDGSPESSESVESLPFEEAELVEEVDELTKLQNENAELEDRLIRTQAELVNFRRRTQNETSQFRKYEGLNLVRDLLPVIDNLKRAVGATGQSVDVENLKTGVEMVIQQVVDIFSRYSIETIPASGDAFDPNLHDAVQQIPSEEIPAMHVVQELETGYRMHDRIVRPGKVIVSTGSLESSEPSAE